MLALLAATIVLPRAHAHNDYMHARPLWEALENGFGSIEPDVYLVDGILLVGHDRMDLNPNRTLRGMYLEPLFERIKKNGGWVYEAQPATLTLMIDIKADGKAVYQALKKELQPYRSMITSYSGGRAQTRAVTIVLSGDRPIEDVKNDPDRFMGVDGRIGDLADTSSASYAPWVSDNYSSTFHTEQAPLPADQHLRLLEFVKQAHAHGQRLRFYGTPDTEAAWAEQWEAGVDIINTDRLNDLRLFMFKRMFR